MISERYHRRLKKDPDIPERYETEMLSKQGLRIPVEISVSYIEHDNMPADMAIIRDLTERRDAEKKKMAITINRNINRILELIENASVFVKLDTLTDIKFEKAGLAMMLQKVANEYAVKFKKKKST